MNKAFAGQYRGVCLVVVALLTPSMSVGQVLAPFPCCDGVQLYAGHEPIAPGDTVTFTIEYVTENIEYLGPTAVRTTVRLPAGYSLWTLHLLRPGPDPTTVDEVVQFVFTITNPMQLVEPLILKPWDAFCFSLRGGAGYPVTVQSSPDFVNWRDLTNMTPQAESVFIFDSAGTAESQRFYRAVRKN